MKISYLKYFKAVADERHFGRAAEKLNIGQPPLSLQIQRFEEELGVKLFHRRSRGVELTEAGDALLVHARYILDYVENAKSDIQRVSRGEKGILHVGFAGGTYFHGLVTEIFHDFREKYPDIKVITALGNTPELINKISEGTVDAAFIRPSIEAMDNIEVIAITEESLVVALHKSDPMASNEVNISLKSLSQSPFILCERSLGAGLFDTVISACKIAGFNPIIEQNAPQIAAIIPMVGAGFGVSLIPSSLRQIQSEGVIFLKVKEEIPNILIGLATRKNDTSSIVKNFKTSIKSTIK